MDFSFPWSSSKKCLYWTFASVPFSDGGRFFSLQKLFFSPLWLDRRFWSFFWSVDVCLVYYTHIDALSLFGVNLFWAVSKDKQSNICIENVLAHFMDGSKDLYQKDQPVHRTACMCKGERSVLLPSNTVTHTCSGRLLVYAPWLPALKSLFFRLVIWVTTCYNFCWCISLIGR